MSKSEWTDKLRSLLELPDQSQPMTPTEKARLETWASNFAAAMEENAAETARFSSIVAAHLEANNGKLDFEALEQMLAPGPSPSAH